MNGYFQNKLLEQWLKYHEIIFHIHIDDNNNFKDLDFNAKYIYLGYSIGKCKKSFYSKQIL